MNPLAARARACACSDPDTDDVVELIARGADVGWIRPTDLPELLESLRDGHDWGSEEIGFEPRADRVLVRFLDETISCPSVALLDRLTQIIAAQERPCGALQIGDLFHREGAGRVVGGTDAGLPGWTTEAIRALVGGQLILDGPRPAAIPVREVHVQQGFTGQRTVFLLISASAPLSDRLMGRG